ncbi:MAG: beta-lactamase family protein [Acidobacteria bacterium]|nr:beta-lactamase family protein [Acidobacteriota bacterium]
MPFTIGRRAFLGTTAASLFAANTNKIDDTVRSGLARRSLPCVVAMAAGATKPIYSGAFGTRDSSGVPVRTDSIFQIASMTKAITTVAALQLVEQGKVALHEPVAKHLPQLANLDVLTGFDAAGKASLKPAQTPVTLHHLLTHTCGLCYDAWDGDAWRYASQKPKPAYDKPGPLMFEPGKRWQYGQGIDWAGRLVEEISGLTLEDYFQQKICRPLGMTDTSFLLPESKFNRLVTGYQRENDGTLKPYERKQPAPPKSFNGGGGLYGTVSDYVRFMQMILNHGKARGGARTLSEKTVESMGRNQIGEATAGKMKSHRQSWSRDVDIQPGFTEKWGYGFLINTTPYAGGRSAGSLAWAGLFNTYYWIDPKKKVCATIMMQLLPFVDEEAVGLLNDFEKAVYANL